MAKKPETKFKEKISPLLEALPKSWWVKTQERTRRGVPDYIGCVRGHFVSLELKATAEDEPDALQEWTIHRILRAQGMAVVVNPKNWPDVYGTLVQISQGRLNFKGVEHIEDPPINA